MGPRKRAAKVLDIEDLGLDDGQIKQIRTALLEWYDANHRVIPWRHNPHSRLSEAQLAAAAAAGFTPRPQDLALNDVIYRVWVCEVMSQQTQLARVVEYFGRWVARWPSVGALAAATQEEVNELWAGLGYYRRARYLLEGARHVRDSCGGAFPTTAEGLRAVPGVGPYTAAAIASNACGERVPVVDGNVVRVLTRLRAWAGPPPTLQGRIEAAAGALLCPDRPGDFNQALMELGATVCVPNTEPRCGACPLAQWCAALELQAAGKGNVADYPTKVEKAARRKVLVVAVVLHASTDAARWYVLEKRPEKGLLAGLWQFPLVELADAGASTEEAAQQLVAHVLGDQGRAGEQDSPPILNRLGQVVHIFSHIEMTIDCHSAQVQATAAQLEKWRQTCSDQYQWLSQDELETKGLSSSVQKVFQQYKQSLAAKKNRDRGIAQFFKPANK